MVDHGVIDIPAAPGEYTQAGMQIEGNVPHYDTTPRRHQAAGDHPARGAELRGRRLPGQLAELELRRRLQRPRGADAAPPPLRRRGRRARSSTAPRSPRWSSPTATRPDAGPQERLRRAASTAWACCAQQPEPRLRLPRPDPLLRRPPLRPAAASRSTIKNAICMHEEDFGILWKHTDRRTGDAEVRRSRRLVISSISTVENYEYGFFWYLYQDGKIQFEVKLTGILSLGAHPGREPRSRRDRAPRTLRAEPSALLQRAARLRPRRRAEHRVRGRQRAGPARRRTTRSRTPSAPGRRRSTRRSRPSGTSNRGARALEDRQPETGQPRRRAGRLQAPARRQRAPCSPRTRLVAEAGRVRRTPRLGHAVRPRERYAAGDYPNQSRGGDGLPKYASRTVRSRTRTSCSGTPSAHTTSPARRTTR